MCDMRACATSVGVAPERARASPWRSFAAADACSAWVGARRLFAAQPLERLHAIQTRTRGTMRLTAQRRAIVRVLDRQLPPRVYVEKQAEPRGRDGYVSRTDAEEDGDEHDAAHERRHEHLAREQLRSQYAEPRQGETPAGTYASPQASSRE